MFRYLINRYTMGVLVIIIGVLVVINFTSLDDRPDLTKAEKIIKDLIAPLESGAMGVSDSIRHNVSVLFSFKEIKKENIELNERIGKLEKENNLLKEYEYQNLRLRQLLNFKDRTSEDYELISASVIGRNPTNWLKIITLNRGTNDGVEKNMAVITDKGLVGRVISVADNSSNVLLILDNNSAVGGVIQITRTPGVVEGMPAGTGYLRMIHVPKDAPIREKQVVVSSGLGGVFPKGLAIGRVQKIETKSNGLVKVALIRPFVDFNRLEEVFIIKRVFTQEVPIESPDTLPPESNLSEGE